MLGANKLQPQVCRCECLFGSAAHSPESWPFCLQGFLPWIHFHLLSLWTAVVSVEASGSWVFRNETVSVFLQKYALYLGMIKGSGVTFSLQNLPIPSRMGNAGAQIQVAQIHSFSLEATQYLEIKIQLTNQEKPQTRRFLNTIAATSLCRTSFLTEQRTRLLLLLCPSSPFTAFSHCRNWKGVGMLRLMRQDLFKSLCSTRAAPWQRFFLMLSACDPFHSFLQLQTKIWKYYIW